MSAADEKNPATATPNENPAITEEKKVLILRTSDGQEFEIEQSIAIQSITIKNSIEGSESDSNVIPLPTVHSRTLPKVIEYLKGAHAAAAISEDDLKHFETNFIRSVENVKELVFAADDLNIHRLLDVGCKRMAGIIKDMPHEPEDEEDDFWNELERLGFTLN